MAPIGLKLCQNAFQTICNVQLFDAKNLPSFWNERTTKLSSKSRTDLRSCVPGAKLVKESDFDVKSRLAPPKSTEIDEKHVSDTENLRRNIFLASKNQKLQIV